MFFRAFSAARAAGKLTNAIVESTQLLVNELVNRGQEVKLSDTGFFLQNCAAYALVVYGLGHPGNSAEKNAEITLLLGDNLRTWLSEAWRGLGTGDTVEATIDVVLGGVNGVWSEFIVEVEDSQEPGRTHDTGWAEDCAVTSVVFMYRIDDFISERFGSKIGELFGEEAATVALNTINDKMISLA